MNKYILFIIFFISLNSLCAAENRRVTSSDTCASDFEIKLYLYRGDFSGVAALEKEFLSTELFWDTRICKTISWADSQGGPHLIQVTPVQIDGYKDHKNDSINASSLPTKEKERLLSLLFEYQARNLVWGENSEVHLFQRGLVAKAVELWQLRDLKALNSKELVSFFEEDLEKLSTHPISRSASTPTAHGQGAVVLIGSALHPKDNPISNVVRIKAASQALKPYLPTTPVHILFGDGQSIAPDVKVSKNASDDPDSTWYEKDYSINPKNSFTESHLMELSQTMFDQGIRKRFWITIGHGGPGGLLPWGKSKISSEASYLDQRINPTSWEKLTSASETQDVILGSTCYGGQMALSANCGFFSAPPDMVSVGCTESPSRIDQSSYYDRFIEAIGSKKGKISFHEAHIYARAEMDQDEVPYTTMDALAEALFNPRFKLMAAFPEINLPTEITRFTLEELVRDSKDSTERAYFFDTLNHFCFDCLNLPLVPNETIQGIRRRSMIQLARRLYLAKVVERYPKSDLAGAVRSVNACENQSIESFLGPNDLQQDPRKPKEYVKSLVTPSTQVEDLTDKNYERLVGLRNQTSVILISAPWCQSCKELKPHFEQFAGRSARAGVRYFIVNMDENPEISKRFPGEWIPRVVGVRGGKQIFVAGYDDNDDGVQGVIDHLAKLLR